MLLVYYLSKLGYPNIPDFLVKYLECPSLDRLKRIGYFCGMDYASREIYDFKESISRFDHSLTTSLLVYKLTQDKTATIAALFHDVGTPCFSHVIDYMNKDYVKQESTEAFTGAIIRKDAYLRKCLEVDGISIEDIINYKKYPIVDNERPKLCADRLDGIILTGIGWTDSITFRDIYDIMETATIITNEDKELEIGFSDECITKRVVEHSNLIDKYCHTKEDNYMMELLASITKRAIELEYFNYEDLYTLDEVDLLSILKESDDPKLQSMLKKFKTITKDDIPNTDNPYVKKRLLNPLCNGKRIY